MAESGRPVDVPGSPQIRPAGRAPGGSQAGPHPLGGSIGVPAERGANVPLGGSIGVPAERGANIPLGGSIGVPAERGANVPLGGSIGVPAERGASAPLAKSIGVPAERGADISHLLYLHGFRSSPKSAKARLTAAWMQAHRPDVRWWCPQLPPSPKDAMDAIARGTADWPRDRMAVIGSSLGGFYATSVAERTGCRAALLNPAVDPARDLMRHIGMTTAWHGDDTFFFRAEFIDELKALTVPAITRPGRYFTVIAKGDEVLDWREMHARYAGCPGILLDGGDHAIGDYPTLMPAVLGFLGFAG